MKNNEQITKLVQKVKAWYENYGKLAMVGNQERIIDKCLMYLYNLTQWEMEKLPEIHGIVWSFKEEGPVK